jgi:hypothetical protein
MEAIKKKNPKELRPEEATNSRLELRFKSKQTLGVLK